MNRWFVALAAISGVAALGASCSTTCAIPECAETVRVELVSRCWPDGRYVVRGTADGEVFDVEVTLPVAAAGSATSPDGVWAVQVSNERGLEALTGFSRPASFALVVLFEGQVVGREDYAPMFYEENHYGGDGCEEGSCPTARMAWYAESAAIASLCAVAGGPG